MPRSSSGLLRVLRINSSTVSGPSDFGRPPIAASCTSKKTQYSPFGRTPENAANESVAALPAVHRSGRTGDSALLIRSTMRWIWQKRASAATGAIGLKIEPSGDLARAERPFVLWDMLLMRIGIEQQRTEREIARHLGRALEGNVEGSWRLRRRTREIDLHAVAALLHRHLHRQMLAASSPVVVEEAFRSVVAVGNLGDLPAQHRFGVIHQLPRRLKYIFLAVSDEQLLKPLDA